MTATATDRALDDGWAYHEAKRVVEHWLTSPSVSSDIRISITRRAETELIDAIARRIKR